MMAQKIISILSVILIITCCTTSNNSKTQPESVVNWISFDQLNELQKTNPKKVYIDFTADWCGYCELMDKNIFANKDLANYLNTNFYAVKIDAESKKRIKYKGKSISCSKFTKMWGIDALPSTLILNESMDTLHKPIVGYIDSVHFVKITKFYGEDIFKTKSYNEFVLP